MSGLSYAQSNLNPRGLVGCVGWVGFHSQGACEFAHCYLLLLVSAFVHAYSMKAAGNACCEGDKQGFRTYLLGWPHNANLATIVASSRLMFRISHANTNTCSILCIVWVLVSVVSESVSLNTHKETGWSHVAGAAWSEGCAVIYLMYSLNGVPQVAMRVR